MRIITIIMIITHNSLSSRTSCYKIYSKKYLTERILKITLFWFNSIVLEQDSVVKPGCNPFNPY
jgi:hypothetical protein